MIEDNFDMSLLWIAHSIAEKVRKELKSDHSTLLALGTVVSLQHQRKWTKVARPSQRAGSGDETTVTMAFPLPRSWQSNKSAAVM